MKYTGGLSELKLFTVVNIEDATVKAIAIERKYLKSDKEDDKNKSGYKSSCKNEHKGESKGEGSSFKENYCSHCKARIRSTDLAIAALLKSSESGCITMTNRHSSAWDEEIQVPLLQSYHNVTGAYKLTGVIAMHFGDARGRNLLALVTCICIGTVSPQSIISDEMQAIEQGLKLAGMKVEVEIEATEVFAVTVGFK
ncbi:hypothetical protein GIB67_008791 [Kingdonia uniflora]|uniref:Uncharacterized protein n=1 Tax=Kingdonia uniflora TaxID=39325 RepID=A0A7J7P5L6_9MAGN|nr:hypothetical protein GIB67_008791 [Kingdonia uniflora]